MHVTSILSPSLVGRLKAASAEIRDALTGIDTAATKKIAAEKSLASLRGEFRLRRGQTQNPETIRQDLARLDDLIAAEPGAEREVEICELGSRAAEAALGTACGSAFSALSAIYIKDFAWRRAAILPLLQPYCLSDRSVHMALQNIDFFARASGPVAARESRTAASPRDFSGALGLLAEVRAVLGGATHFPCGFATLPPLPGQPQHSSPSAPSADAGDHLPEEIHALVDAPS